MFALILCFIVFWYADLLFERYFIFGIIPILFSVLSLLASLVISIICAFRNKKIYTYYVALGFSIITFVLIFVFPFRNVRVQFEMKIYENDRLEIVEMIKNEKIHIDEFRNAKLPKKYDMISSDGSVYVYKNDIEQVISFWVFRGLLSGSIQVIYSSEDETLIFENENGHPVADIHKLKVHWYLVETDY